MHIISDEGDGIGERDGGREGTRDDRRKRRGWRRGHWAEVTLCRGLCLATSHHLMLKALGRNHIVQGPMLG